MGPEILAFVSHCSANFQPILNWFIPNFKLKYEDCENIEADPVNTGVFLGHPIGYGFGFSKYSAPKLLTSQCYTNSLKRTVLFHLSVDVAEILSIGSSDQYSSSLWTEFFISFLMVEELFVLKQEDSYVTFN